MDTIDPALNRQPVTLLLCALGGEGGGVLSEWLVDAAALAGYAAQSTSIPGVAQRTGATTYYVEIFPVRLDQLGGRTPVLSLYPVPGALDLLVSSELLETVRQIGNGMASAERTQVISSSARTFTTNERMQLADGRIPDAPLTEAVRRYSREHHLFDMTAMTQETGTVVSAVMFGAIAASGALPFGRDACEAAIRAGGKGTDASLRGFARAYAQVGAERERGAFVATVLDAAATGTLPEAGGALAAPRRPAGDRIPPAPAGAPGAHAPALPAEIAARFPAAVHDLLALGHARMRDYQDDAYAALYVTRLARVLDAERAGDPEGAHAHAITRETARYLALWMAFDDIVRVAEHKCRASRAARVKGEVKAGPDDLVRIYDHFKPGMPEIAGLLPDALATRLLRWDRRRQSRGKPPLSWPLKLKLHSVTGYSMVRLLAACKGLRRHGSRFALEQELIGRWIDAIEAGARLDWTLGREIALCGRLIKGYGSTNERGKENLLHVIDHLARGVASGTAAAAAEAIRSARTAALADENGAALDRALVAHGAPARPVRPVPIRFMRRPDARAARGAS